MSNSGVCTPSYIASNSLRQVDIDEHYSYVEDSEKRKIFAAESYLEQIGGEILCQVGIFYRDNARYPNVEEIREFASEAINDDLRAGVYDIKLETGSAPNEQDFTLLFDVSCDNERTSPGDVVVLSPLYGGEGRYCVYQNIDRIVNNINKTEKRP